MAIKVKLKGFKEVEYVGGKGFGIKGINLKSENSLCDREFVNGTNRVIRDQRLKSDC